MRRRPNRRYGDYLAGAQGDAINAVLAAVGDNFRLLPEFWFT
jgi:hypothetical protein